MIQRTILITACIILTACCTSKKSTTDTNSINQEATMSAEKMLEEGYKSGTITYSDKENDCDYTIKLDGEYVLYYDAINLDDAYKKDGMKIWFTFNGLRMPNRCEKANPIQIYKIQKQ
jgi:hypothetical protein